MNENTIESFINFCSDMMIAEESNVSDKIKTVAKTVWINIRTILKKIIQLFKNLIMNVNYFRTAKMPSQQSKDIITVVQNLTPRYEILIKTFMCAYRVARKQNVAIKQNQEKLTAQGINVELPDAYENVYNSIDQSMDDIDEIISTTKNSDEYKRIVEDKYDSNTIVEIPLSNIITAMKKSQNELIQYDSNAQKMQIAELSAESPAQQKAAGRCRQIYTKLCEIFKLKIRLLRNFFEHAKASVSAVGKNIAEKKNKTADPNRSYSDSKNFKELAKRQGASEKKVKFTPEQEKRFKELNSIISGTKNDITKYPKYFKAFSELCKLVGAGTNVVLIYNVLDNSTPLDPSTNGERSFIVLKENSKPMKLLSNTQLYHTSPKGDLTELTGRYFHTSLGLRRLWSTPRVYFSIGNAMSRDGSKYTGEDPLEFDEKTFRAKSLHKYVPVNHIDNVYRDVEMGVGSAVYVESKVPIKIKKMQ